MNKFREGAHNNVGCLSSRFLCCLCRHAIGLAVTMVLGATDALLRSSFCCRQRVGGSKFLFSRKPLCTNVIAAYLHNERPEAQELADATICTNSNSKHVSRRKHPSSHSGNVYLRLLSVPRHRCNRRGRLANFSATGLAIVSLPRGIRRYCM